MLLPQLVWLFAQLVQQLVQQLVWPFAQLVQLFADTVELVRQLAWPFDETPEPWLLPPSFSGWHQ